MVSMMAAELKKVRLSAGMNRLIVEIATREGKHLEPLVMQSCRHSKGLIIRGLVDAKTYVIAGKSIMCLFLSEKGKTYLLRFDKQAFSIGETE